MRKAICLLLAVLTAAALCGCSLFGDFNTLLNAPKSPEDLTRIQQVLEEQIKDDNYVIQYPSEGKYISSPLRYDLDGDGVNEAFVFYSTANSDDTLTMHLAFLRMDNGDWSYNGDMQTVAPGVDFITFADLDGSGISEAIVGWSGYNSTSGTLAVYKSDDEKLVQCLKEDYSAYCINDIDLDGRRELFIISEIGQRGETVALEPETRTVTASLYRMAKGETVQLGTAETDSSVERYDEPVFTEIDDGRYAVVVDGYASGGGMLTEAFVWEDGKLTNLFYDRQTGKTAATFRKVNIPSRDYNGDGIIEIPEIREIPQTGDSGDPAYFAEWKRLDGDGFNGIGASVTAPSDGYIVDVPLEWKDRITVERDSKNGIRSFGLTETDSETAASVFSVKLVEISRWSGTDGAWFEAARDDKYIYAAAITGQNDEISRRELEMSTHLLTGKNTGGG